MRRAASPMDADHAANTCEEDEDDMNFTFAGAGGGAQFLTAGGQVAKLQQGVGNGTTLQQMVSVMGEGGVQYVRTLDGGAALTTQPQLITLPIQLPGSKPGDPQQTVQIQVLNPSMLQQQPKYQMQIPIQGLQGFQQGGAVLTVQYTPEGTDGIMMNSLPDGLQVVTIPQEMQLVQQQDTKEQVQQAIQQQQQISGLQFISQSQQIVINRDESKLNNNNNNNNNSNIQRVIIKEECDDLNNDDESSQGTDVTETWQLSNNPDIMAYINKMPQTQHQQPLPVNLQQFLRLNPVDSKSGGGPIIEVEVPAEDKKDVEIIEDGSAGYGEDVLIQIKKKKKYKKKPPKPAKPKPGQVQIGAAQDGSVVYCCPECELAYPDLEQLEQHLAVHKIERRFICNICGAGLKRKEHLERHKLGHNPDRPYVCAVCRKGFKRREHLNLHTVIHSGVKTELCLECGKGFYRKDHLRKHTRSHESRRARDDASGEGARGGAPNKPHVQEMAAITIHVPTSANCQVPVQINIPQHVVTSLAGTHGPGGLEALLTQHT